MSSLSVVIPCLNEANTIGTCIRKAILALQQLQLDSSEIIIADNGSTDGSQEACRKEGVTLITVEHKGYGAALDAGIKAATCEWIIFGDGDDSYDFGQIAAFIPMLEKGCQLVVGNRYTGNIQKGAMPFLHRYLGTPVISFIGRRSFRVSLGDFNCGMRAITKRAYLQLDMKAKGMEFASEMIAKAGLHQLKLCEVPVNLYKDGRGRKPHLRTWQDGWKHLRLILLLSPKWLLLYPAMFFLIIASLLGGALVFSFVRVFQLVLDIHTLYYASVMFMVGIQLLQFYIIARLYGSSMGLYPARRFANIVFRLLAFEKALLAGAAFFFTGIALTLYAVYQWQQKSFGPLDPTYVFRIIIPAGFCISVGMQIIVFGFLLYTFRQFKND
ncbi:glycosyltransferase family 2 protein [soil metagenome]